MASQKVKYVAFPHLRGPHVDLAVVVFVREALTECLDDICRHREILFEVVHITLSACHCQCRDNASITMRFLLIGQNRSISIGKLGLFWVYFDRIIGNA